jgi:hypothetical protein
MNKFIGNWVSSINENTKFNFIDESNFTYSNYIVHLNMEFYTQGKYSYDDTHLTFHNLISEGESIPDNKQRYGKPFENKFRLFRDDANEIFCDCEYLKVSEEVN